ncbi:phosphodiester glycosidase family protein [Catenulispora pinisilvae]|uniref:phosphodiester glycosidase family protein n=1 Tax=Catenulispora pinisilvae TaxID=2705253 RepID=UPI00189235CF|nr:phosphodiester glycosidase family protein [Catenulispora pinisilvae]
MSSIFGKRLGLASATAAAVVVAVTGCSSGGSPSAADAGAGSKGAASAAGKPGNPSSGGASPSSSAAASPGGSALSSASSTSGANSPSSPSAPSSSATHHVPVAPGSSSSGPSTKLPPYLDSEPVGDAPAWRTTSAGVELAGDGSAFAARFDPAAVRFALHAGSQVPGGSGWQGGNAASASGLVAGWNGGFLMANDASWGGFYLGGRTAYGSLRTGTASEVFYKDGSMDVLAWPGGLPSSDVLGVRQNLALMINDGKLAADLDNGTSADERTWGFTNNSADVHGNRSGIGVTADGRVLYAAVHGASPLQLAQYLQRAGAVRAMQLDINFSRPIFGTYATGRWTQPASWLGPAERFTSGNERDFVVVYAR